MTGGTDIVLAITFSPDGRLLAVSGIRDSAIRVWRLPSGELVRKLFEALKALGIPEKDLKTTGVSVNPKYHHPPEPVVCLIRED